MWERTAGGTAAKALPSDPTGLEDGWFGRRAAGQPVGVGGGTHKNSKLGWSLGWVEPELDSH